MGWQAHLNATYAKRSLEARRRFQNIFTDHMDATKVDLSATLAENSNLDLPRNQSFRDYNIMF